MRVISGQFKGRRLEAGIGLRPTEDKVKKALFDILRPIMPELRFLDLYAGSGGVGIEALSHAAKQAYFVENDLKNCGFIETNLNNLKTEPKSYKILQMDVDKAIIYLNNSKEKFDFIFLDPPYYKGEVPRLASASTGSAFTLSERSESKGSGSASPKDSESLAPRLGSTSLTTSRSGSTSSPFALSKRSASKGSGSAYPKDSESLSKKTLQTLEAYDILSRNGFIIVQHHRRDKLLEEVGELKLWRTNSYSTTQLSFYTKATNSYIE